jgi:hypothetical protein
MDPLYILTQIAAKHLSLKVSKYLKIIITKKEKRVRMERSFLIK